jgi:hypothetical protein
MDREGSVPAILERFSFFDQAITDHGFTEYNRDYRLVAEIFSARRGRGSEHDSTYTFLFKGCAEAHYNSVVPPFAFLMDDIYLDLDRANDASAPGFIWGVNQADAYPGLTYLGETERSREWSAKLGLPMHEVLIETNTYSLRLVFNDVSVEVQDRLAP